MIRILDSHTANGIAAGEVIERPASVVKELIENAIDAGAGRISIEIEQGGIKLIRVADNGIGMSAEDAKLAFERHATSKIRTLRDLEHITSMGFRGEALASIAAVSRVKLITRREEDDRAFILQLEAGKVLDEGSTHAAKGTIFEVSQLFFNTPARYKFLKRDSTEAAYVQDLVERYCFTRPDISFSFKKDGKEIILTPGDGKLISVLYTIWGQDSADSALPIASAFENIKVAGFVSKSSHYRKNRSRQIFIVNNRVIQSALLRSAVDRAIQGYFVKGQFPELVLLLEVATHEIDVNVHPQKTEVRFSDEQKVFRAAYHSIKNVLEENTRIKALGKEIGISLPLSPEEGRKEETSLPLKQMTIQYNDSGQEMPFEEENLRKIQQEVTLQEAEENPRSSAEGNIASGLETQENIKGGAALKTSLQERIHPVSQAIYFSETNNLSKIPTSSELQPVQLQDDSAFLSEDKKQLSKARIIGQAFNTYLILEEGEDILLVDQHAAHERILFEKLLNKHKDSAFKNKSQLLLKPLVLRFSTLEIENALAQREEIEKLGFHFEEFSENSFVVRAIPLDPKQDAFSPETAFRSIIEEASEHPLDSERQIEESLHTVACKAAVKAHDILSYEEMKRLVQDLLTLEDPFHCPHGRPVVIRITRYELEKLFARKV